jgi:hypothetical protein
MVKDGGTDREKLAIIAKPAAKRLEPLPANNKPPLSDQGIRKMQAKEVIASIRGYASNWTKEAEAALAVPGDLNFMRNDVGGTVMYSKEKEFRIADAVHSLQMGIRRRPETDYGIAIYEKAGTAYIVLVDLSRRIIVRELITDYNGRPAQKDWSGVVRAVDAALAGSKAAPERIAVYDGALSYI